LPLFLSTGVLLALSQSFGIYPVFRRDLNQIAAGSQSLRLIILGILGANYLQLLILSGFARCLTSSRHRWSGKQLIIPTQVWHFTPSQTPFIN